MSRRLFFTYNRPANVDNRYVVGAGVGSRSRFVRSALRRRSSNNAQGKPCCFPMPKPLSSEPPLFSNVKDNKICTGEQVWKECGSACTATCDDPTPICTKQCVAHCECPAGQYLEGEKCITPDKCPVKEDTLTGTMSLTSTCPTGWNLFNGPQDTSFCCLSSAWDPSGCTDINAACYLSGTKLNTLCPDSSMVMCDDIQYTCNTKGQCLPSLQGTQPLKDCSQNCSKKTNYTGRSNGVWCWALRHVPPGKPQNYSASQCGGQFEQCQQKYAFPYYYYDMYLTRVMNKPNTSAAQLEATAINHAVGVCSSSKPQTWDAMGSPSLVYSSDVASIYKAHFPDASDQECAHAVIISSGEAQNMGVSTDPSGQQYEANSYLWGIGYTPDTEAEHLKSHLAGCETALDTVPEGWISEDNPNKIGGFCHARSPGGSPTYWGVEWGGGMCSGGDVISSLPKP